MCESYLGLAFLLVGVVKTLPLFDYFRGQWGLIWDGRGNPREKGISMVDGWVLVLPAM